MESLEKRECVQKRGQGREREEREEENNREREFVFMILPVLALRLCYLVETGALHVSSLSRQILLNLRVNFI